jgi:hypothetical protein
MTKNTKVFLGVGCGVLLIGAIVVIVGGIIFMKTWGARFAEATVNVEREGREFGKTTDQQGCMNEGVQRSRSAGLLEISAGIELAVFVDTCLAASRPTPNFCDGVPSFWSPEESKWEMAECKKAGVDPEKTACIHVMKRKHQFCSKPL